MLTTISLYIVLAVAVIFFLALMYTCKTINDKNREIYRLSKKLSELREKTYE